MMPLCGLKVVSDNYVVTYWDEKIVLFSAVTVPCWSRFLFFEKVTSPVPAYEFDILSVIQLKDIP